jgi:ankyrin repeat protein
MNGGLTPLHLAALSGQSAVADRLVAAGADLDAEDDRGLTPLEFAVKADKPAVARLLRGRGAQ